MAKNKKINVQGVDILLYQEHQNDYISLTDIARHKDSAHTDDLIKNWMRNRNTIELLGFGKVYIIPILNPSNSTGLENKLVSIVL
ncbi:MULTISPECIES: KilA-N domain-containing protein [Sphingobacterium]|uniref:KilA-N domain-containing protein n=1 Tax=Sphingobacterium TaxID=28453 RepID=UPI00257FCE89|nr:MULTISPECIES: KilA-N domain-containing protein [Sphingobacterium]